MTPELATQPPSGWRRPALALTRPWPFCAIALFAYFAWSFVLPLFRIRMHSMTPLGAISVIVIPTGLYMLLLMALVCSIVRLRLHPNTAMAGAAVAAIIWIGIQSMPVADGKLNHAIYAFGLNLGRIATLTFFGILLSLIVRSANVLLPVAVIVMPIDYLGAMTPIGFTATVIKHHPDIVNKVSVSVPTFGSLQPLAIIGPGDILFMALFFAIAVRLQMNLRATFYWMYGLLTGTLFWVILGGAQIAALVPMGAATVIANKKYFRFKRSEVFAMIYAAILVFALIVAFYFYSHRLMSQ